MHRSVREIPMHGQRKIMQDLLSVVCLSQGVYIDVKRACTFVLHSDSSYLSGSCLANNTVIERRQLKQTAPPPRPSGVCAGVSRKQQPFRAFRRRPFSLRPKLLLFPHLFTTILFTDFDSSLLLLLAPLKSSTISIPSFTLHIYLRIPYRQDPWSANTYQSSTKKCKPFPKTHGNRARYIQSAHHLPQPYQQPRRHHHCS
jgi:hypothetical protein